MEAFFVSLPLEKQLASVLSDDSVKEELLKSLEKNGKPVASASDITEGTMYTKSRRKLKCSKHDLTVTMNADGGSMFNSSNYSIWPVQLIINELPPRLRWSSVLLPLLWYGSSTRICLSSCKLLPSRCRCFLNEESAGSLPEKPSILR